MSVNNVQIVGNIFKDSITSEHSRFVSGMTEERSYRPDSWSQSELYDFIGCVTIKGLSFLDIIHNIDCYVVFDGQTTVLELRKMDFRTRWMTARIYPVVSGGWTVELRETETNRTGRLTESVLSFSAVIPSPGGVVRRVTTLLLMTALGASASRVWQPGDNLWFSSDGRRQLLTTDFSLLLFTAQDGGEG